VVYLASLGLHRSVSVGSTGHHDRDRAPTGGIGRPRRPQKRWRSMVRHQAGTISPTTPTGMPSGPRTGERSCNPTRRDLARPARQAPAGGLADTRSPGTGAAFGDRRPGHVDDPWPQHGGRALRVRRRATTERGEPGQPPARAPIEIGAARRPGGSSHVAGNLCGGGAGDRLFPILNNAVPHPEPHLFAGRCVAPATTRQSSARPPAKRAPTMASGAWASWSSGTADLADLAVTG